MSRRRPGIGSRRTKVVRSTKKSTPSLNKKKPVTREVGQKKTPIKVTASQHKRKLPGVKAVKPTLKEWKNTPVTMINKDVRDMVTRSNKKEATSEPKQNEKLIYNSYLNNVPDVKGGTIGLHFQAGTAVRNLIYNGTVDENFKRNLDKLGDIMQKYRITSEELMEWYEKNSNFTNRNFIVTGLNGDKKLEYGTYGFLRLKAKPPRNFTPEERKVWDYYMFYQRERELADIKHQLYLKEQAEEQEAKRERMADFSDFSSKTNNSFSDVIRTFISERTGGKYTPIEATTNLIKNTETYLKQYYFNPLSKGEFGTLAMNQLVNLGETLDLPAIGVRAYLSANKTVYGTGDRIVKGQDYWVYSGGKKKQKELVELGAYDIIKYSSGHYANDNEYIRYVKNCEASIKEAGLWGEFLKFKEQYNKLNMVGDHVGAVKEAYTSHKNYEADTGSTIGNLALETFSDPSLIVGGFAKSFSKAGISMISRNGVREGLKAVIKEPTRLNKVLQASDNYAAQYYRVINENIFSSKTKWATIEKNIDRIGHTLLENGDLVDENELRLFKTFTVKAIKNNLDSATYKAVLGARLLDKSIDLADSTALKTLFAAPYLGYKSVKPAIRSFKHHRLVQASARVLDEFVNERGMASIVDAEEYMYKLGAEPLTDEVSEEVFRETFYVFQKQAAEDISTLRELRNTFIKDGTDILVVRDSLNALVEQMSHGKFITLEELKDFFEKLHFTYLGKQSEISKLSFKYLREIATLEQLMKVKTKEVTSQFYSDLSKVKDYDALNELYLKAEDYRGVLSDNLFADITRLHDDFSKEVLDDIVATYERIHSTTINKKSAIVGKPEDIETAYEYADRVLSGHIYHHHREALKELDLSLLKTRQDNNTLLTAYGRRVALVIEEYISNTSFEDMDYLLSLWRLAKKDAVLGNKTEVNAVLDEVHTVLKSIVDETYSYYVRKDTQLLQMQLDKLVVWDKYLMESNIVSEVLPLFEKYGELDEILSNYDKLSHQAQKYFEAHYDDSFMEDIKNLKLELDTFKAVMELREKLNDIPEIERYAVLEVLFGISKGTPLEYANMNRHLREKFINKVELWLDSNYGKSKVSLDGFSSQALDFTYELYGKYFKEVKNNPALQDRIKKFLEGGHFNPINDVQKQMFQIILKDPTTIAHYNSASKRQDILFTDIETEGFNGTEHAITSIATKKWVEIPEDASLSDILDILEDSNSEKLYQTFKSEDYITSHISDDILDFSFKNDPTLCNASKEAKRQAYCERYSVAANGGKELDEAEMLDDFLRQLDKSYVDNAKSVPKLVVHNNNGFDLDFIRNRCIQTKRYPIEIDHIDSLVNASENTLARLKGLTNDHILTDDTKRTIVYAVEDCMRAMSESGKNDLVLFSPEKIADGLNSLYKCNLNFFERYNIGENLTDGLSDNYTFESATGAKVTLEGGADDVELLNNLALGLMNFNYENGDIFRKVYETYIKSSAEARECMQQFSNNIIANEFRIKVSNLSDEALKLYFNDDELESIRKAIAESDFLMLSKYDDAYVSRYLKDRFGYTKSQIDNFMRMSRELNNSDVPILGQRVLFDEVVVSKYFDELDGTLFNKFDLEAMQEFSKSVTNTINKRLESTEIVEPYIDELKELIIYLKEQAMDVSDLEELNYFKYLKVPDSVAETYVMAHKLFDMYGESYLKDYIYQMSNGAIEVLSLTSEDVGAQIFKDIKGRYVTPYLTDIVKDSFEFNVYKHKVYKGYREYEDSIYWLEDKGYESAKDLAVLECYSDFAEFINELDRAIDDDAEFIQRFIADLSKELDLRRQVMTSEILKTITKSEDDLISHLLYHNHILNIPLKGSRHHMQQVEELLQALKSYDSKRIVYHQERGFIHIGIRKGNQIEQVTVRPKSKKEDPVVKFAFVDEPNKVYEAPVYSKIEVAFDDRYYTYREKPKLAALYNKIQDQIYRLTEGTSAGSVGALHTFSKQKEYYKLLPERFVLDIVSEQTSCDARIWHRASFDMSNLGDSTNCWKFGNANDVDPISILHENLKEICSRDKSEKVILDSIFGEYSELKLKDILPIKGLGYDDKLRLLKNVKGHVAVILVKDKHTKSGYAVRQLDINDAKSLATAEKADACFLPYDVYLELEGMFNESVVENKALKVMSKFIAYLKCGQIMFTGTWMRNWMDATIKTISDTGSLGETAQCQVVAMQLWNEYHKVLDYFEKQKGISLRSMASVRREFKYIPDISITFEQFEFLEGWFRSAVSGGQSQIVKEMLSNNVVNKDNGLKRGSTATLKDVRETLDSGDLLGTDIEAFQNLGIEEVEKICNTLDISNFEYYGISKARFLEGYKDLSLLSDKEYFAWNMIAQEVIQRRAKKFVHPTIMAKAGSIMDVLVEKTLTPMSRVEEIVRLGEYLALEAQGLKRSEIFKNIVGSQFNYDTKSLMDKVVEVFIPFYTFDKANFVYWAKQISENPRMFRYLEHLFGGLTWENTNFSSEERMQSGSIHNVLMGGNVPLGDSGLYVKTNPSFLGAYELLIGGPDAYLSRMSTPLQFASKFFLREMGADSRAIFSEVYFDSIPFTLEDIKNLDVTPEEVLQVVMPMIPYVGSLTDKFSYTLDIFNKPAKYKKLADEAQDGWQGFLVRAFPSVFGAVDMDAGFFEKARGEGVLSSWGVLQRDYKRRGYVWDYNQKKFVKEEDFIPGFLNSDSLAWEEVQFLNFVLHGTTYDANQGKQVRLGDDYVFGGLNTPNLSWDELCSLKYAMHGEVWNREEHRWEQVTKPQVRFVFKNRLQDEFSNKLSAIVRGDKESMLSKLNLIAPVFADKVQESLNLNIKLPYKDEKGVYILTGDSKHDAKVFELIKSEVNVSSGTKYNAWGHSYMRYNRHNYAGGFRYKRESIMPSDVYRNARTYYRGIKSGGRIYGKPYSSGENNAALRMATSNNPAYDTYYNYEYNFSYKYRAPIKGIADYPQTMLGLQRYAKLRGESLRRDFQNRNRLDKGSTHSMRGQSTKARINRIKMHWWNR